MRPIETQYYPNQYLFIELIHLLSYIIPISILQKIAAILLIVAGYLNTLSLLKSTRWSLTQFALIAGWVFFVANPFFVERFVQGQWYFLGACVLIPKLIEYVFFSPVTHKNIIYSGLFTALCILFSPHMIWIILVIIGVRMVLWSFKWGLKACMPIFLWAGIALLGLLPSVLSHTNVLRFTLADLSAFSFRAEIGEWAGVSLMTLGGFWAWSYHPLPAPIHEGATYVVWWVIYILCFPAWILLLKSIPGIRRSILIWILLLVGGLAIWYAGPNWLDDLQSWLFSTIPFLSGMRDTQKWSILLVCVLSISFPFGISMIERRSGDFVFIVRMSIVFMSLYILSWALFGFWGLLRAQSFTNDWYSAREFLAKKDICKQDQNILASISKGSPCNILILPWHQSSSFNFSNWRVIAHPGGLFFSDFWVVVPDNIEIAGIYSQSIRPVSQFLSRTLPAIIQDPSILKIQSWQEELVNEGITHVLFFTGTDETRFLKLFPQVPIFESKDILIFDLNSPKKDD
jgi:hypothetical protein